MLLSISLQEDLQFSISSNSNSNIVITIQQD